MWDADAFQKRALSVSHVQPESQTQKTGTMEPNASVVKPLHIMKITVYSCLIGSMPAQMHRYASVHIYVHIYHA